MTTSNRPIVRGEGQRGWSRRWSATSTPSCPSQSRVVMTALGAAGLVPIEARLLRKSRDHAPGSGRQTCLPAARAEALAPDQASDVIVEKIRAGSGHTPDCNQGVNMLPITVIVPVRNAEAHGRRLPGSHCPRQPVRNHRRRWPVQRPHPGNCPAFSRYAFYPMRTGRTGGAHAGHPGAAHPMVALIDVDIVLPEARWSSCTPSSSTGEYDALQAAWSATGPGYWGRRWSTITTTGAARTGPA